MSFICGVWRKVSLWNKIIIICWCLCDDVSTFVWCVCVMRRWTFIFDVDWPFASFVLQVVTNLVGFVWFGFLVGGWVVVFFWDGVIGCDLPLHLGRVMIWFGNVEFVWWAGGCDFESNNVSWTSAWCVDLSFWSNLFRHYWLSSHHGW